MSKVQITNQNLKLNLKLNLNQASPVQIFPIKEEEYQGETLVSPWR